MTRAVERFGAEWRSARRSLWARRWRAGLSAGLLAVALAANTLVFSTADSLVFQRHPYPDAERLVGLEARDSRTGRPTGLAGGAAALDEWRRQGDVFSSVHTYLSKVIFLVGAGEPELVNAADVTPGLVEMLGTRPRWGRSLTEADARQATPQAVLIAESLARERFGDPSRAVGQLLSTTAEPLTVVGVMPESFRFPAFSQRIWRALDPRGPLAKGYGLTLMARINPAMPLEAAGPLVEKRGSEIAEATGGRTNVTVRPVPVTDARTADDLRRLLLVLLGAAACLLLIACANVASLEVAAAIGRARTYAVHLALGASHAALARTALLEGASLVGGAVLGAYLLAHLSIDALARLLPRNLIARTANPIDLDERALLFMAAAAAATWLVATLPVMAFALRADLLGVLKMEGAGSPSPAGTRLRRAATVVQVALAVLLLVGSVVYVRSYLALLKIEKGFDSSGVVSISLTIPPQRLGTAWDRHLLAESILERVRSRPGVVAAFEGSPPPSMGDSPTMIERLEVDDRPPFETDMLFPRLWVTADYFRTLGIPLLEGRMLEPGDPPTNVLVTEALARRLWPNDAAVGHQIRESPDRPWYTIVGVVGHVRTLRDGAAGARQYFQLYSARPRPKPPAAAAVAKPRGNYAGPSYGFLTITARVDSRSRTSDLYQAVRSVDASNILELEFVDDLYARQHADRLLAARIISGFGIVTFLIAIGGIYGLMVFLVAARTREIGIRMAMGADATGIRRLVLGSSMKLVAVGVALGVLAVWIAGRWVQAQLYGISAADPLSIAAVALAIGGVALLAAWHPARAAARVDPSALLRQG